jgi:hypothetical protein
MYDLIIVTQSSPGLIEMTEQCITSARKDCDLNVIIVETGQPYKYKADKLIEYNGEFNYNRALNLGLKYAKNKIQILANNDLIFREGWSKIGEIMKVNGYLSASALSNDQRQLWFKRGNYAYEGYNIGYQLAGWCIFTDKELWNHIGKLDETHQFWFSDNVYAEQLKKANIKHALICSVVVDHLGSQTLRKQSRDVQRTYTYAQGRAVREFKNLNNAERERVRKGNT